MSVVVVLKEKNKYVVGCDTRVTSISEYFDSYNSLKKAKHIDNNNEIIIAAVR